jgi:hypothetical protein
MIGGTTEFVDVEEPDQNGGQTDILNGDFLIYKQIAHKNNKRGVADNVLIKGGSGLEQMAAAAAALSAGNQMVNAGFKGSANYVGSAIQGTARKFGNLFDTNNIFGKPTRADVQLTNNFNKLKNDMTKVVQYPKQILKYMFMTFFNIDSPPMLTIGYATVSQVFDRLLIQIMNYYVNDYILTNHILCFLLNDREIKTKFRDSIQYAKGQQNVYVLEIQQDHCNFDMSHTLGAERNQIFLQRIQETYFNEIIKKFSFLLMADKPPVLSPYLREDDEIVNNNGFDGNTRTKIISGGAQTGKAVNPSKTVIPSAQSVNKNMNVPLQQRQTFQQQSNRNLGNTNSLASFSDIIHVETLDDNIEKKENVEKIVSQFVGHLIKKMDITDDEVLQEMMTQLTTCYFSTQTAGSFLNVMESGNKDMSLDNSNKMLELLVNTKLHEKVRKLFLMLAERFVSFHDIQAKQIMCSHLIQSQNGRNALFYYMRKGYPDIPCQCAEDWTKKPYKQMGGAGEGETPPAAATPEPAATATPEPAAAPTPAPVETPAPAATPDPAAATTPPVNPDAAPLVDPKEPPVDPNAPPVDPKEPQVDPNAPPVPPPEVAIDPALLQQGMELAKGVLGPKPGAAPVAPGAPIQSGFYGTNPFPQFNSYLNTAPMEIGFPNLALLSCSSEKIRAVSRSVYDNMNIIVRDMDEGVLVDEFFKVFEAIYDQTRSAQHPHPLIQGKFDLVLRGMFNTCYRNDEQLLTTSMNKLMMEPFVAALYKLAYDEVLNQVGEKVKEDTVDNCKKAGQENKDNVPPPPKQLDIEDRNVADELFRTFRQMLRKQYYGEGEQQGSNQGDTKTKSVDSRTKTETDPMNHTNPESHSDASSGANSKLEKTSPNNTSIREGKFKGPKNPRPKKKKRKGLQIPKWFYDSRQNGLGAPDTSSLVKSLYEMVDAEEGKETDQAIVAAMKKLLFPPGVQLGGNPLLAPAAVVAALPATTGALASAAPAATSALAPTLSSIIPAAASAASAATPAATSAATSALGTGAASAAGEAAATSALGTGAASALAPEAAAAITPAAAESMAANAAKMGIDPKMLMGQLQGMMQPGAAKPQAGKPQAGQPAIAKDLDAAALKDDPRTTEMVDKYLAYELMMNVDKNVEKMSNTMLHRVKNITQNNKNLKEKFNNIAVKKGGIEQHCEKILDQMIAEVSGKTFPQATQKMMLAHLLGDSRAADIFMDAVRAGKFDPTKGNQQGGTSNPDLKPSDAAGNQPPPVGQSKPDSNPDLTPSDAAGDTSSVGPIEPVSETDSTQPDATVKQPPHVGPLKTVSEPDAPKQDNEESGKEFIKSVVSDFIVPAPLLTLIENKDHPDRGKVMAFFLMAMLAETDDTLLDRFRNRFSQIASTSSSVQKGGNEDSDKKDDPEVMNDSDPENESQVENVPYPENNAENVSEKEVNESQDVIVPVETIKNTEDADAKTEDAKNENPDAKKETKSSTENSLNVNKDNKPKTQTEQTDNEEEEEEESDEEEDEEEEKEDEINKATKTGEKNSATKTGEGEGEEEKRRKEEERIKQEKAKREQEESQAAAAAIIAAAASVVAAAATSKPDSTPSKLAEEIARMVEAIMKTPPTIQLDELITTEDAKQKAKDATQQPAKDAKQKAQEERKPPPKKNYTEIDYNKIDQNKIYYLKSEGSDEYKPIYYVKNTEFFSEQNKYKLKFKYVINSQYDSNNITVSWENKKQKIYEMKETDKEKPSEDEGENTLLIDPLLSPEKSIIISIKNDTDYELLYIPEDNSTKADYTINQIKYNNMLYTKNKIFNNHFLKIYFGDLTGTRTDKEYENQRLYGYLNFNNIDTGILKYVKQTNSGQFIEKFNPITKQDYDTFIKAFPDVMDKTQSADAMIEIKKYRKILLNIEPKNISRQNVYENNIIKYALNKKVNGYYKIFDINNKLLGYYGHTDSIFDELHYKDKSGQWKRAISLEEYKHPLTKEQDLIRFNSINHT